MSCVRALFKSGQARLSRRTSLISRIWYDGLTGPVLAALHTVPYQPVEKVAAQLKWSGSMLRGDGGGLVASDDDQEDEQATSWRDDSRKRDRNPGPEPPRGSRSRQQPHNQAQVVAGDVDQVALVQVLPAAQPSPAHATAVED